MKDVAEAIDFGPIEYLVKAFYVLPAVLFGLLVFTIIYNLWPSNFRQLNIKTRYIYSLSILLGLMLVTAALLIDKGFENYRINVGFLNIHSDLPDILLGITAVEILIVFIMSVVLLTRRYKK